MKKACEGGAPLSRELTLSSRGPQNSLPSGGLTPLWMRKLRGLKDFPKVIPLVKGSLVGKPGPVGF